jgi:hypothetical protein
MCLGSFSAAPRKLTFLLSLQPEVDPGNVHLQSFSDKRAQRYFSPAPTPLGTWLGPEATRAHSRIYPHTKKKKKDRLSSTDLVRLATAA